MAQRSRGTNKPSCVATPRDEHIMLCWGKLRFKRDFVACHETVQVYRFKRTNLIGFLQHMRLYTRLANWIPPLHFECLTQEIKPNLLFGYICINVYVPCNFEVSALKQCNTWQHKIVAKYSIQHWYTRNQIWASVKCDNTSVYSNSPYDGPEIKGNMWWLRSQLAHRCGTYIYV